MRVTSIEVLKKGIFTVLLDASTTLTLAKEIALATDLKVGSELTPEEVLELNSADRRYRAHEAALRYLSYRPRSEKEVKDRLRRAGFKKEIVEPELEKLKELSLINDTAFATSWKDGREASRPRSRRMMGMELRRKGIPGDVVARVVSSVDEESGAYTAAAKKARTMGEVGEKDFIQRLGTFLQRRGYGYELSRRIVLRLWEERAESR